MLPQKIDFIKAEFICADDMISCRHTLFHASSFQRQEALFRQVMPQNI